MSWLIKNKYLLVILFFAFLIRFIGLTKFPPSIYWEEAALGYDAYSILKTGKDFHGHTFPLVAFESFGDYKPSLYFYVLVPFIGIFGLSELTVRLPSVLAGVVIVYTVHEISLILFKYLKLNDKQSLKYALMAAFITAIEPWAIIFSRAAWESNLATALLYLGITIYLKNWQKFNIQKLLSASFFFALSMYAYHSNRVSSLLVFFLFQLLTFYIFKKKYFKHIIISTIFFFLLLAPIIKSSQDPSMATRFNQTSIFSNTEILERSVTYKSYFNNNLYSRIVFHRYVLFGKEIIKNILSNFDIAYLILNGDNNPRHSVQFFGQIYHLSLVMLILGLVYIFHQNKRLLIVLVCSLLIFLLPSAVTTVNPHALRTLSAMPIFMIIITTGLIYFFSLFKKKNLGIIQKIVLITYCCELILFMYFYAHLYPKLYASEWQYGYKEMIASLESYKNLYQPETIYISREQGRPSMYYWFFTKADPHTVQAYNNTVSRDQGEFLQYQNIHFFVEINNFKNNSLIVIGEDKKLEFLAAYPSALLLKEIKNFQDQIVFNIYQLKNDQ